MEGIYSGLAYVIWVNDNTTTHQAIRSGLQGALGPAPSKQLRPFQDCESRVLMYDLVNHGDKSLYLKSTGHHVPADGHWYAPVRRYVSTLPEPGCRT